MTNESFDYYDVLEVSTDSTQDIIYMAYKSAKETFSLSNPNLLSTFSETEALEWINIIEEAYSIIGHSKTRREYDNERQALKTKNLPSLVLESNDQIRKDLLNQKNSNNTANTTLGTYEVNPQLENLIEKQEVFDGLFLKKIREYKKIDLTEFSKHTCIAIRHLYAIENNNFSVLPAPVFVRGYIVQYCRSLNLEQDRVVNSFMSLLKNG